MDITKVKAGSIKLLGDGLVLLGEAAAELGTTQLALATQLAIKNVNFFVEGIACMTARNSSGDFSRRPTAVVAALSIPSNKSMSWGAWAR